LVEERSAAEKAFQGAFGDEVPYVEEMRFRGKDQTLFKANSSISASVGITVTISREERTVVISADDTAGVTSGGKMKTKWIIPSGALEDTQAVLAESAVVTLDKIPYASEAEKADFWN
jgi:hypothetical protein